MVAVYRNLLVLIGRSARRKWLILVLMSVAASLIEMVGAVMIYLLITIVTTPDSAIDIPLLGTPVQLDGSSGAIPLNSIVLMMAAFFVFRAGAQVGISYTKHRIAHKAGAQISIGLVTRYLGAPYEFFLGRSSSEFIRNAQTSVREITQKGLLQAIFVLSESIMILGLLTVMLLIAPAATALAVTILGATSLVLLLVVQPRMRRHGFVTQQADASTLAVLQQAFEGIRDVKSLAAERFFAEAYGRRRREQARSLYIHGAVAEVPKHIIETTLFLSLLSFFMLSLARGSEPGALLGSLGVFGYVGLRVMPSVQRVISGLNHLRFIGPAVQDVVTDFRLLSPALPPDPGVGEVDPPRFESVHFRSVDYSYPDSERPAVHGIDLEVRRGQVIGICGPTGGGKTTILDLLTGLLTPTRGSITLNGGPLADALAGQASRRGGYVRGDAVRRAGAGRLR